MPRWFFIILLALALVAPAQAQEAATLGTLPNVQVMTALKSGDWDDLDDLIGEALDEVEELAEKRGFELTKNQAVIYQVMGLKTFRARIGYLLDPAAPAMPGRLGGGIELQRLEGPAYVASGTGGAAAVARLRRRVLDEIEKPGVRRVKGVETIEIFYGEMDDKDTKVEVYGPVARR